MQFHLSFLLFCAILEQWECLGKEGDTGEGEQCCLSFPGAMSSGERLTQEEALTRDQRNYYLQEILPPKNNTTSALLTSCYPWGGEESPVACFCEVMLLDPTL